MKQQSYRIINDMVAYNAASHIKILPHDGKWEILIREHKSNRSLAQNRLLWQWHTEYGSEIGEIKEDVHREFKWRFIRPILIREDVDGSIKELFDRVHDNPALTKALTNMLSSRDLNVTQMAEALTEYDLFCATNGYPLSHPEDLYFEAIA